MLGKKFKLNEYLHDSFLFTKSMINQNIFNIFYFTINEASDLANILKSSLLMWVFPSYYNVLDSGYLN